MLSVCGYLFQNVYAMRRFSQNPLLYTTSIRHIIKWPLVTSRQHTVFSIEL